MANRTKGNDDKWIIIMIKAIKAENVLWDNTDKNYCDKEAKRHSWETVVKKVKQFTGVDKKGEALRKKWNAILENFNRRRTGTTVRYTKHTKYVKLLTFMEGSCHNDSADHQGGDIDCEKIESAEPEDIQRAMSEALDELFPNKDANDATIDDRCQELVQQFRNLEETKKNYLNEMNMKQAQQEQTRNKRKRSNLSAQKSRINKGKLEQIKLRKSLILCKLNCCHLKKELREVMEKKVVEEEKYAHSTLLPAKVEAAPQEIEDFQTGVIDPKISSPVPQPDAQQYVPAQVEFDGVNEQEMEEPVAEMQPALQPAPPTGFEEMGEGLANVDPFSGWSESDWNSVGEWVDDTIGNTDWTNMGDLYPNVMSDDIA